MHLRSIWRSFLLYLFADWVLWGRGSSKWWLRLDTWSCYAILIRAEFPGISPPSISLYLPIWYKKTSPTPWQKTKVKQHKSQPCSAMVAGRQLLSWARGCWSSPCQEGGARASKKHCDLHICSVISAISLSQMQGWTSRSYLLLLFEQLSTYHCSE